MKVLNYGSLNIDLTFRVPHIVVEGETLSSTGLTKGAGGKGANQSAALAKAGIAVYHAGKIGKDGQFLLDELSSYGVHTDYVTIWDGPSGQAIIQLDEQGRNSIVLLGGGNKAIQQEEIAQVLTHFGSGDWLVLQNEINSIETIMKEAAAKGIHILFNPAPFDASVFSLPLDLVDIIVVNETEGQGLAGIQSKEFGEILVALARKYPKAEIILTVGDKGSYYAYQGKVLHEPIIKVKAEDTTGAGDTFIGYFLASKLLGCTPEQALKNATKASSLAVSRKGAMVAIPFKEEVFS